MISTNGGTTQNYIDIGFVQRPLSVDLNGNVIVIYESKDNNSLSLYSVFKDVTLGWQSPDYITSDLAYPLQIRSTYLNIGLGTCGFAISLWEATTLPDSARSVNQVLSSVNFGAAPLPPCSFIGNRCHEKFATQSVFIDQLTWGSCDTCALFYNLYNNGANCNYSSKYPICLYYYRL